MQPLGSKAAAHTLFSAQEQVTQDLLSGEEEMQPVAEDLDPPVASASVTAHDAPGLFPTQSGGGGQLQ